MKSKILTVILIAAMVGSMAGCGNSGTDSTADTTVDTTVGSVAEKTAAVDTEESAETEESAPAEVSQTADIDMSTDALVDEESWKVIQDAGLNSVEDEEGKMSVLSFTLDSSTLEEEGDYYIINATFAKPVTVDPGLQVGDTVTVTTNDLTGETKELTVIEENVLQDADGMEYYYYSDETTSPDEDVYLYCESDDRVDSDFYEGKLCISKSAKTGVAIMNDFTTVSADTFAEDSMLWFNGLYFDENGVVVQLIFYGD